MQKRKFDELISHFNRKVSDMGIDQKYKMELLGMISAIGFAHENELGANLAEVGTDCISRRSAIDALRAMQTYKLFAGDDMLLIDQAGAQTELMLLPPIQPKRGRWISADAMFGGVPFYCSECGENTRDTVMGEPRWNFCPNCGAKMEVNHESN